MDGKGYNKMNWKLVSVIHGCEMLKLPLVDETNTPAAKSELFPQE